MAEYTLDLCHSPVRGLELAGPQERERILGEEGEG